jgi:DNA-binding IclR family transcriptional regulator
VVAAPVVAREQLLGAIAIAAPTARMNALRIGYVGKRCIKAALEATANLAGRQG